jgi:hypothetical protein
VTSAGQLQTGWASTASGSSCAPIELVSSPDCVYEEHKFHDSVATLLTVQCVARWADQCAICHSLTVVLLATRDGCPTISAHADALVVRAWTDVRHWLDQEPMFVGYLLEAALLWRGEFVMLDMHDADWSHLYLTVEQTATLQQWWVDHHIPSDLYVLAAARQSASRPVSKTDHVVFG